MLISNFQLLKDDEQDFVLQAIDEKYIVFKDFYLHRIVALLITSVTFFVLIIRVFALEF